MTDEFNEFISNWKERKIGNELFDRVFQVEGIPLSWFYRPILYSSLLPRPFPSTWKIKEEPKCGFWSLKIFHRFTASFIYWSTIIKAQARKKNRVPVAEKTVADQGRPKILFLGFTNQIYFSGVEKIPKLEKVIEKVEQDGQYQPFVLTADLLSSLRLPTLRKCRHTVFDYDDEIIFKKNKKRARELHQAWENISEETKKSWLQFKGESYWGLVRPSLELLYSEQFIFAVLYYYEHFKKVLDRENIRVMVLTSQNNIFEKSIIAAAKQNNIPVLVIQHGLGLGMFRNIDLIDQEKFAVWGEHFRRSLFHLGLKEENVAVTGNLALDRWSEENQAALLPKHILVTTGPFAEDRLVTKEEYFEPVRKIVRELEKLKGHRVIFKLHPRERYFSYYQKILRDKDNFTLIKKTDQDEYSLLLRQAALIITFGSSITLEAVALGKKALIIDIFNDKNILPSLTPHFRSVPIIGWKEFTGSVVTRLLREKETRASPGGRAEIRKDDIKNYLYKTDGRAYQRVVDEIYKLAGGSAKITSSLQAARLFQ